jgi:hypothetical protein
MTTKPGIVSISSAQELRSLALDMVRRSRSTLDIVSRNLEPAIFDTRDFVAAVKSLVINNPKSQVRIIVLRPELLQGVQHRLIDLTQRLNSFMAIRRPSLEDWEFNESMIIGDRRHLIHCRLSDRFDGIACYDASGRAAHLLQTFNQLWEYGEPDPNFRQLLL